MTVWNTKWAVPYILYQYVWENPSKTKSYCPKGALWQCHKDKPLKRQWRLQQTINFAATFLIFEKKIRYDISWELSASRQFSWKARLICYFWKSSNIWNCRLLQIVGGALLVNHFSGVALLLFKLHTEQLLSFPGSESWGQDRKGK